MGLRLQSLQPRLIERWRELIQCSFPFVNTRALRLPGGEDWPSFLEAQGYDARIAEKTLAIIEQNDARPAQLSSL